MLVECLISTCGLYECIMCSYFAYDIIRNDYNCCRNKLEYVIIERNDTIIPVNEININSIFEGYPKVENEIID